MRVTNSRWIATALAASKTTFSAAASSPSRILVRCLAVGISGGTSSSSSSSEFYTIGLTGSGGLVGKAILNEVGRRETLNGKPIRVVCLSRGKQAQAKTLESQPVTSLIWNPKGTSAQEIIHPEAAAAMDALVHLSGEDISTGLGPLGFLGIRPWTEKKKTEIIHSRVETTTALSKVVAQSDNKIQTFLCASGVGVYGDKFVREDLVAVDETAKVEDVEGFLAHVSRKWEGATMEAKQRGHSRVVNMRLGVIMSKKGGALQKLYPVFFLGGGGIIGSGKQYFTFVSARDVARAILHTLETPSLEGPVNFCAPEPCTNAEFTKALGSVLNRPTLVPFPGFAVSLLFGQMGEEMLLGGVRAVPKKLRDSGFEFLHPTITQALSSAMEEDI